jgi:phenylpropionate dioxygenase-like ring-hydroxylating dioxygenase large terminal subunit
MSEFLWNAWYVAALSSEVGPAALFARRLLDKPVLLYRTEQDGTPVAMLDRCLHRFSYLSKGRRRGDEIECLYPGLRFAHDGRCTRRPFRSSSATRCSGSGWATRRWPTPRRFPTTVTWTATICARSCGT